MRKQVFELRPGDTFLWRRDVAVVHDVVEVPSTIPDLWSLEIEVPSKRWRGAVQARGSHTVEVLSEGRGGTRSNPPAPREAAKRLLQEHCGNIDDATEAVSIESTRPGAKRQARQNPSVDIAEPLHRDYERFHGHAPNAVREFKGWYPGDLVQIGKGVDIGYNVTKELPSKKEGFYVHDFGAGVRIYKRAPAGAHADLSYHNFPVDRLQILGRGLGFTYEDDRGKHEVKGSRGSYLATTPDRKTLVFIDSGGVKYLARGGKMRVEDWIYD